MSTDVPTSSSDSMISRSSKSSIRSFLRSGGIKTYQNNSLLGANFAFDLYQSQSKFSAFGTTLHHIAVKLSSQTDCLSPVTVDILIDLIKDKMQGLLSKEKESLTNSNLINVEDLEAPVDDFMCPHCRELLYKPVTLLCGHSFCQLCLKSPDRPMTVCNVCNVTITEKQRTTYGNNVVLTAVFESWHKVEWKGRALTCEGIALLQNREYEKCIKKLTDAIELVPQSHSAYLNRAKAKFFLKQYESALKDATCAAIAAHKSPEAYFVKGEILVHLDYTEEALFYFTTCLILDPSREDAEKRTHDIVTNMITPHYKSSNAPLSNKRPHSGQSDIPYKRKDNKEQTIHPNPSSVPRKDEAASSSHPSDDDVTVGDVPEMTFTNRCVYPPSVHAWALKNLGVPQNPEKEDMSEKYEKTLEILLNNIDKSSTNDLLMLRCNVVDKELVDALGLKIGPKARLQDGETLDDSDLECSLCMRLLCDPVCTPCGHIFCQVCIERCLDHKAQCPLCKTSAQQTKSLEALHSPCDYVTKAIIRQYLPEEYAERQKQNEQEIEELTKIQPIFVSTIAFPSVPCPLHIFEPRYMLMLRRCLDHNDREFGMCMRSPDKPHHEIGTTLRVKNVKFFPDGRSVVDSVGNRRFQTTNCQKRDGYHVATLKYIEDKKIGESQVANMKRIIDKVYSEAEEWFASVAAPLKEKITLHFGNLPEKEYCFNTANGPNWLWWVLAVLPVEDTYKANIVGNGNLQERVLTVHKVFLCLMRKKTQTAK